MSGQPQGMLYMLSGSPVISMTLTGEVFHLWNIQPFSLCLAGHLEWSSSRCAAGVLLLIMSNRKFFHVVVVLCVVIFSSWATWQRLHQLHAVFLQAFSAGRCRQCETSFGSCSNHKSLEACPHLLRHDLHWPRPEGKQFSRLHWCRGGRIPVVR